MVRKVYMVKEKNPENRLFRIKYSNTINITAQQY